MCWSIYINIYILRHIYIHTNIYTYIHKYTIYMYIHTNIYTYIHKYTIYMYIHTNIYTYIHKYTIYMYIHTNIYTYIHKYTIYMYIYTNIYTYIHKQPDIGLAVRVFANGPEDLGSIPGRVIPKTQKMVLDASLLNTQHYKVRIKGKVEQSREGVAPSPTPWCSSYRKGSLRVTLDYGRQLYFTFIYTNTYTLIYIYIYRFIGLVGRVFANSKLVQSQVKSYQRFKKWYLILLCLTLSIIRYVSRVKWSNQGEGRKKRKE